MEGDDTSGMASEFSDAFAGAPIPNTKCGVHATRDEFQIIELKGSDSPGVAFDAQDFLALGHVPDPDSVIVRARDKHGMLNGVHMLCVLEACNTVQMSFESAYGVTTATPIAFEF